MSQLLNKNKIFIGVSEKSKGLTFREPAEMLGHWGETHVILSRKTITVQLFRP